MNHNRGNSNIQQTLDRKSMRHSVKQLLRVDSSPHERGAIRTALLDKHTNFEKSALSGPFRDSANRMRMNIMNGVLREQQKSLAKEAIGNGSNDQRTEVFQGRGAKLFRDENNPHIKPRVRKRSRKKDFVTEVSKSLNTLARKLFKIRNRNSAHTGGSVNRGNLDDMSNSLTERLKRKAGRNDIRGDFMPLRQNEAISHIVESGIKLRSKTMHFIRNRKRNRGSRLTNPFSNVLSPNASIGIRDTGGPKLNMTRITLASKVQKNSHSFVILLLKGGRESLTQFIFGRLIPNTKQRRGATLSALIRIKTVQIGTKEMPIISNSKVRMPIERHISQRSFVRKDKSIFSRVRRRKMKRRKDSGNGRGKTEAQGAQCSAKEEERRMSSMAVTESTPFSKIIMSFKSQRPKKSSTRKETMRELSDRAIKVTTDGNLAMTVVEHEKMKILT